MSAQVVWQPRRGLELESPGFDGYIGGLTEEHHVAFLSWSEAGAMSDATALGEPEFAPAGWYLRWMHGPVDAVWLIGEEGGVHEPLPAWDASVQTLDLVLERASLYVNAWEWAGRPPVSEVPAEVQRYYETVVRPGKESRSESDDS